MLISNYWQAVICGSVFISLVGLYFMYLEKERLNHHLKQIEINQSRLLKKERMIEYNMVVSSSKLMMIKYIESLFNYSPKNWDSMVLNQERLIERLKIYKSTFNEDFVSDNDLQKLIDHHENCKQHQKDMESNTSW